MGVRPIEYRPWRGERTDPERRFLVISWNLFRRSLRSKGVIVVLVFGILLAHTFPIIGAIISPHKELTDRDMVGFSVNQTLEDSKEVTGGLAVDPAVSVDGRFTVDGNFSIVALGGGDRQMDARLVLHGSISGRGMLSTAANGSIERQGMVLTDGAWELSGILVVGGSLSGNGTIRGFGNMTGNGTVVGTHRSITVYSGGYLTGTVFVLFTAILAAIICSDVISDDLADSSFVLYFSRPVRGRDYLLGKTVGLLMVMSLFCLVLPLLYVLVMMGTQSGGDYGGGLVILGKTFLVGLLTAAFFLPFGLLLSSLTPRKAYAGVGIFASFFVLVIVGEIFAQFDATWAIIDPINMLQYTYIAAFGGAIPNGIAGWQLASVILAITAVPMAVVYWLVQRRGAGR